MRVRLDDQSTRPVPWEFTIFIGERSFPTRPITMPEALKLESIGPGGIAGLREGLAVLEGIVVGPKPNLWNCDPAAAMVLLAALVKYWKQYVSAAVQADRKQIADEAAETGTAGTGEDES